MIGVNIGCGQTPTEGYHNYDNSWSIRLANKRSVLFFLNFLGFIQKEQFAFIEFCRKNHIRYADAIKYIPEKDASIDIVYSSHMLEHLDRDEVKSFLNEVRRVLKPGGFLRLVVPDLTFDLEKYLQNKNADDFIEGMLITKLKPKTFKERLKYIFIGDRHHQWMYDGASLCKLLLNNGFSSACVMESGSTSIPNSGHLDLKERESTSVFVEAIKL